MKLEWLHEARMEYRELLSFYVHTVGAQAAEKFSNDILSAVETLADFPEMGVLKEGTLLGKYGFRALFIGKYVCVYRIENDTVYIFHLADARSNYMYNIFGIS